MPEESKNAPATVMTDKESTFKMERLFQNLVEDIHVFHVIRVQDLVSHLNRYVLVRSMEPRIGLVKSAVLGLSW